MPETPVISVEEVSKAYRIWASPAQRLISPLAEETARLLPSAMREGLRHRARSGYKDFYALERVSFDVKPGEAVGIIGRNGAGKSTLLQIIAGTLQPTIGRIQVRGRVAALLELGAGFNPDFTGRENVHLSGAVLGLTRREVEERFEEITVFADIGEFIDQPVKTYSSGMLMRLAFAVNTCVDPDILIVDEALSVGDAPFQAKCFRRLRQLIDKGVSLLFVSHDIGTVRSICSRALWLKSGRVEMWGEAKAVAREYEKYCWAEQGIVMEASAAATTPPSPNTPERQAQLDHMEIAGEEMRGDFTVELGADQPPPQLIASHLPHASGEESSRYGTRAVTIDNFLITDMRGDPVKQLAFNEVVVLHYLLTLHEDINSDFILGVRVKDTKDNFLFSVQDITRQHRIEATAGTKLYARTAFRVPFTHDKYLLKTGLFGFADGQSRPGGHYDYSRAILWDVVEDNGSFEVTLHADLPLVGPVHAHADLLVNPFKPDSPKSSAIANSHPNSA